MILWLWRSMFICWLMEVDLSIHQGLIIDAQTNGLYILYTAGLIITRFCVYGHWIRRNTISGFR